MSNWIGLDSGGVEQLWQDELLLGAMKVLAEHEPFSYGDINSEFYQDLYDKFEDITWFSIDRRGSPRTIFRRANPFLKLGLIEGNASHATLTDWGHELVNEELSLTQLYQFIARAFVEQDGTRSFAAMCNAAFHFPNIVFNLEDVEFAVSRSNGKIEDLSHKLQATKLAGQRFLSGSRRPRILRTFMNTLVRAGALKFVENGWMLDDPVAANYIMAGTNDYAQTADASKKFQLYDVADVKKRSFSYNEIAPGERKVSAMRADAFSQIDNSQRMLLLERANSEHENLVELTARELRAIGGIPIEGASTFDVGCVNIGPVLVEVKHINKKNAISQFRKAIAQLPEYRWRHKDMFPPTTKQVIAVSENPRKVLDPDYIEFVSSDRNLNIIWREQKGLVDIQNQTLREILNLG